MTHALKILVFHNYYQQLGGEDRVFQQESDLLRSKGHHVIEYVRENKEITNRSLLSRATLGLRTTWAWDTLGRLKPIIQREEPDIAHFHNTFPLISPAAYYACQAAGIPVVQTLHNPRLLCPAATFFRDGRACEDCLGRTVPWPGIVHACYRNSIAATAAVAAMLTVHRLIGTWQNQVSKFIASTEFYRQKFIDGGLPPQRIAVKPHFVFDPGPRNGSGEYALYIGRLALEKGVPILITAWERMNGIPLRVRGDGPLAESLLQLAKKSGRGITLLRDVMPQAELFTLIKGARFLVWPSEGLYETFGLVAIEAFACGVPVISARTGVMEHIVTHGHTGLHFTPGDPDDLAAKVVWAWEHREEMAAMGRNARAEYEAKYTAERNYEMLMSIYETVLRGNKVDAAETGSIEAGVFQ